MNERIKQLAMQTDIWCDQIIAQGSPMYNNQWEQKFAELIVAECAAIINDIPSSPQGSWSDGYYEGCRDSAKQIKQDFGIKE